MVRFICYGIIFTFATSCAFAAVFKNKFCFPPFPYFVFGAATAAYQVEGAWNASGKGESIWDRYTHQHPERIFDGKSGDVADDSYHQFRTDVKLAKELGLQMYRFSISWPRILPTGLSNNINDDGVKYYQALIEELIKNNITPMVTMYHWDLPQSLQDLGGWTNPIIADYFVDYTKVLFDKFGHYTFIWWLTFNEPLSFCQEGYGGDLAPGAESSGFEDYMCGHNVLRAHAKVYKLYKERFSDHRGAIGITLDMAWMEPATTSPEDQSAAEIARQFKFGWFAHPIFSAEGDYPPIMRQRIDEMSRKQNFSRSRLPKFTREEIESLKGSYDFLGLNHYTTYLVTKGEGNFIRKPSFQSDMGVTIFQKPTWPRSNSTWLKVVPWGFRKTLNWIKNTYNNPLIMVTENGYSLEKGLQDTKRVNYIDGYLRNLYAAIVKDGCSVVGYFYWSLIDNFEWNRGYSERFGLYEVDYKSENRTRTPRLSARYYAKVVNSRCLPLF